MLRPLSNQTSVILWGGRGIGRSITLALARNGSEVAFSDPSQPDLEKVRDLLISKKADLFATVWGRPVSEGEETYSKAAEDTLARIRTSCPLLHRIVLPIGVDERFWSGPIPGDPPNAELILGRVEAVVRRSVAALANQEKAGRLLVLWPSEGGLMFDETKRGVVRMGETRLRDLTEEAAGHGVGVSLLWVGSCEEGLWTGMKDVEGERLRLGEIADTVVALAGFPRRVVLEGATIRAFGAREPEKPGKGEKPSRPESV